MTFIRPSFSFFQEDFDLSGDDDEPGMLTVHEFSSLTNSLNSVIFDFLIFLDHCSLKRSIESMEQTVQELIELIHLETSKQTLKFFYKDLFSLKVSFTLDVHYAPLLFR